MPKSNSGIPDTSTFLEEILKRTQIPDGEFVPFLSLWEIRSFRKNEIIQNAGEVAQFSVYVLKGCLRQYIANDKGDETNVYFAEERHFIGDLNSMRSNTASSFFFQALEDCDLLLLTAENWNKAHALFPWWTDIHLAGFQKWSAIMQQQLVEMQTLTGEERYIKLLKLRPSLFQRISQHQIASYLGITPETLSRIRKKIFNV
jgi:CRP-like cAMP-binding protein